MSDRVRIACVQYPQRRVGGFADFAAQVEDYVRVASDYDCDQVLLPELFTLQLLSAAPERLSAEASIDALSAHSERIQGLFTDLASRFRIDVFGGTHLHRGDDGRILNLCYVALRDGSLHVRPKIHATPNERGLWHVEGGDDARVIQTAIGPVGLAICYDSEFPELSRHLADQGALILMVPFCTDVEAGYWRVRHACAARAVENQVYVALAGAVGTLPGVANFDIQHSQSAVLTPCDLGFPPRGVLTEAAVNVEGVIVADLDMRLLQHHREGGSVRTRADRRHDLYRQWA